MVTINYFINCLNKIELIQQIEKCGIFRDPVVNIPQKYLKWIIIKSVD